jgi:hypothetical protein
MDTTFSYDLRVLMCEQCGAPLEIGVAGGHAQCRFCGAAHAVVGRNERPVLEVAAQAPVHEHERIARLRAQDGRPLLPPPSLQGLMPDGNLPDWKVNEAVAVWQGSRREVRATGNFEAAERLLFLTMVLSNKFAAAGDFKRQRAMFESALEVFTLPRHRQMMLGYLARSAVRAGDLKAAQSWLAPCDPRSDDLQSDSAYRFSRAMLDTALGNFPAVLQLLGPMPNDVPIMDAMDPACAILRANAHEKMGNVPAAIEALRRSMSAENASGRMSMEKFRELNPALRLCEQSYPAAMTQHTHVASRQAAARASGGIHYAFIPIGLLCLIGSFVCVVLLILSAVDVVDESAGHGAGIAMFTTVPLGVIFTAIGFVMRKAAKRAAYLRAHGISGQGRVVGLQPTGTRINGVPQMAIRLQIELPGRAPYEATTKMLGVAVPPGAVVNVRVDPRNPADVIIETA